MSRKTVHTKRGFFVTGTDTGVGKTIIAGALVTAMHSLGLTAGIMKPIESGCRRRGGRLIPGDGTFLRKISGADDPVGTITPSCFESPLAPLPASEKEARDSALPKVRRAFQELSEKYEALVVEGIGGLMVPIAKDYFVIDLAGEFGLPLIIVAKPGLGTINHTMLSVEYALKRGLEVAGVVINFNNPPDHSLAEETNPELLRKILPVPLMGIFPHLEKVGRKTLKEAAFSNLDMDVIGKYIMSRCKEV